MSATTQSRPGPTPPDAATGAADSQRLRDRIVGADGMRAAAALAVIFSHLYQRLNPFPQAEWYREAYAVFLHGAMGVSIFFVLSGMLLSYPFWAAYLTGRPMPRLGHFARRRFARIAPGYYVALTVSVLLGLMVMPDAPTVWWRYLAGLTFTSGFHYQTFFPSAINGPLWSISFEVVSYALLPLTLAGLFVWRAWRRRAAGAATEGEPRPGKAWAAGLYWVGAFAAVNLLNGLLVATVTLSEEGRGWEFGQTGGAKFWMPGYNPLGFFGHFMLGIGAALAIATWRVRKAGAARWFWDGVAALGIVGALALVWIDRWPAEPNHMAGFQNQPYLYPLFAGFIALALVGLAHSRLLGRLADNRFARYTATVSFGLYIWHFLLITLLSWGFSWGFEYAAIIDPYQHLAIAAIVLAASYGVATLSWRRLEKPVLESRWARGLSRRD